MLQVDNLALIPTAVLLPPPLESLHCGLPSPEWPSDHISLLTKFTLRVHPQTPPPPPPNPPNIAHGQHLRVDRCRHRNLQCVRQASQKPFPRSWRVGVGGDELLLQST